MTARRPIFYGWWIVGVATGGVLFGYSGFVSTAFGLFVLRLQAAFGWSRTELSLAVTLATALVVVLSPIVGALVDRVGVRRVLLPSLLIFGLAIAGLSLQTGALWQMYALYALIACAGTGTTPIVFGRIIVNWFDRRRGLALGITLSGVGLAGVVLPLLIQPLIDARGWRVGYLALSAVIVLLVWPVACFLVRDTPAEKGCLPDGHPLRAADGAPLAVMPAQGLSLREALRTRHFWQMVAAFLPLGTVSVGMITHLAPLLAGRGYGALELSLLLAINGAALIVGRVLCGLLVDRYFGPYVAAAFLLSQAAALGLLGASSSFAASAAAVVLLGMGFGAEFDVMAYLISRYLGLTAYGKVYGLLYSAFSVGAMVGPIAMGRSYDALGSYSPALHAFTVAPVLAALLLITLGPYRWAASAAFERPSSTRVSLRADAAADG
jgi:MFS family permease